MLSTPDRLRKLWVMSWKEIASRAGERARYALERRDRSLERFRNPDRLGDALVEPLRHGDWRRAVLDRRASPTTRFFGSVSTGDELRELFRTRYARELDAARLEASCVASGRIRFFGREFRFDTIPDWHADPVSGRGWPPVFHADVPIHEGGATYGDVKYVWELNRHQFLIDLAKSAFLDGNDDHRAALLAYVRDWTARNPCGIGVNWASPLEPAFRVYSWLWAYHLLSASARLAPDDEILWLTAFHDHGRFLHRHLEHYASPYNHLVNEAAALFMLGCLFDELAEAAAWKARGRQVLEATLPSQFHADGGSVEQSAFYHHATLGAYLLAALLGRENDAPLSTPVWAAIERAIAFSMALQQPDGSTPPIGGADDGKPIRMEHRPLWDFRPYQAIGAVLFERADFRQAAGDFPEDALWLLGPAGLASFERLAAVEPPLATGLSDSGYFLSRSSWAADADYLLLDCGEQAHGVRRDRIATAVHGHADCLSLIVWLSGRPVLVDPGFYCYNGDPEWVSHFRRTRAHNTVQIDGRDQATYLGKMAWCHAYRAEIEAWSASRDTPLLTGTHDGYRDLPGGSVRHRRTAWLRPAGYVVILDQLHAAGVHQAEAVFQFAPGTFSLGDGFATTAGARLAWSANSAVEANWAAGGPAAADGWIAPSLGVRTPAPRLALRFRLDRPVTTLLTVVADETAGRVLRVTPPPPGTVSTPALLTLGGHGTDWIVAGPCAGSPSSRLATDARLVTWRERAGAITDVRRIGGTYAAIDGRPVPTVGTSS